MAGLCPSPPRHAVWPQKAVVTCQLCLPPLDWVQASQPLLAWAHLVPTLTLLSLLPSSARESGPGVW